MAPGAVTVVVNAAGRVEAGELRACGFARYGVFGDELRKDRPGAS
jgi:hypothetical protein